tara:strand:+ start:5059 stop:5169 length:111 start_codon:yes stop_codon:yes gene_type:complete
MKKFLTLLILSKPVSIVANQNAADPTGGIDIGITIP